MIYKTRAVNKRTKIELGEMQNFWMYHRHCYYN